jgi:[CysO sulfur-carrier protein]-S-L-cysteine hydrolase
MQLLLARPVIKRLRFELRRAGRQEIGGVMMGEHVRDEVFRVIDITVQRSGGSEACFVRNPNEHRAQLQEFFDRTGSDYSRFNYLGEWHSHPSFTTTPSVTDIITMQSIVEDPDVGVNFLTLLIPKLSNKMLIEVTAMAFRAGEPPLVIPVYADVDDNTSHKFTINKYFNKFFEICRKNR